MDLEEPGEYYTWNYKSRGVEPYRLSKFMLGRIGELKHRFRISMKTHYIKMEETGTDGTISMNLQ